jgi:hypothetical protein
LEDFLDCLNGQEAMLVKLRMQIEKLTGSKASPKGSVKSFDVSKIQWQKKTGEKGEFELSEDFNSLDHKALLMSLAKAGGCINIEGWFYWVFKNGSSIGRKNRN